MKPSASRRSKTRASRRTSATGHSSSRRSSARAVESWAATLVVQRAPSRTAARATDIIGIVSSPGQELPQARNMKYTANTRKRIVSAHAPSGPAFWMTQRNPMTSKSTGLAQWARSAPNAQTAEKAANQMASARYARDGVRVIEDTRCASRARPRRPGRGSLRGRCDAKHDHAVCGDGGAEAVAMGAEVGVGPEVAHRGRTGREPEPPEWRRDHRLELRAVEQDHGAGPARQRLHPHLQRRRRLGDEGPLHPERVLVDGDDLRVEQDRAGGR